MISLDHLFYKMFNEIPLYNHISSSTRFRGTKTPIILDFVLTSEENVIEVMRYVFDYIFDEKRTSDAQKLMRKIDTFAFHMAHQEVTD